MTDQLMTTRMEKMLFSFFSGAKISYSRYNKKERRMAKQLQEHRSLYKAHDSSKDLVKANTEKAAQRKRISKFQMGVQTTMPNNSSNCPPRRNTTNNTNRSVSPFQPTSITEKLKLAPNLPKQTRSGQVVQKPDAFEFTHSNYPQRNGEGLISMICWTHPIIHSSTAKSVLVLPSVVRAKSVLVAPSVVKQTVLSKIKVRVMSHHMSRDRETHLQQ